MSRSPKNTLVLIDGENLVHQVLHLLRKKKLIEHRQELTQLDLRGLIEDILRGQEGIEIRYFTTKTKLVKQDAALREKSQGIIDHQRLWKRNLTRQDINYIAAGNLKLRDGLTCRNCGHQEPILQEKGVDVRLAVDLLIAANSRIYKKIYLVSSDTDLLPAINAAMNFGQTLVYVAPSDSVNLAITSRTKSVLTFTEKQIINSIGTLLSRKKTDGR